MVFGYISRREENNDFYSAARNDSNPSSPPLKHLLVNKVYRNPHAKVLAEKCTTDQKNAIGAVLKPHTLKALTQCPSPGWIEDFYKQPLHEQQHQHHRFLGISVGCNKGYDAINTARMGMANPFFDKERWGKVMKSLGLNDKGLCGTASKAQFGLEPGPGDTNTPRDGEMHCIEPMPSTHRLLQNASESLMLKDEGFHIFQAVISSTDGTTKFPSWSSGIENLNMDACGPNGEPRYRKSCVDIPMLSLESYVDQHVDGTGPIHILQIDVEGNDFDVLFGAGVVLDRTHYLEFEYHKKLPWRNLHLTDATRLLNGKGFTCYWMGTDKLWRITGCELEAYDHFHDWSNVACVHRSQTELSEKMEDVFLRTIS